MRPAITTETKNAATKSMITKMRAAKIATSYDNNKSMIQK